MLYFQNAFKIKENMEPGAFDFGYFGNNRSLYLVFEISIF